MADKYYHNTSRWLLNQDEEDFIESYRKGDLILVSEAGCAIVEKLEHKEIVKLIKEQEENSEE